VRDFRGLNPKSSTAAANYSLGIKEHIIFPESMSTRWGNVGAWTSRYAPRRWTDDEARALFDRIQFPVPAVRRRSSLSNAEPRDAKHAKKSSIEKNNLRKR